MNTLNYTKINYDSNEHLIIEKISKDSVNTIHTAIYKTHQYAHALSSSIRYAKILLDQKNNTSDKINAIINKVLSFQQLSPAKNFYGLWPKFAEEPLEQMPRPDENIATYMLESLIQIYIHHKDKLPKKIVSGIQNSCCAASTFIVNRNCPLFISHIVLSECLTCTLTGELFSKSEFINYSEHKLKKFLYAINSHGDFIEDFNSPLYYLSMASILGLMLKHIQNKSILQTAERLNKILWKGFSTHYHYPTGQLAGPYSRSTTVFFEPFQKHLLLDATIHKSNSSEMYCPEEFLSFFNSKNYIEYSQRLICNGSLYPYFIPPQVATTYIQPSYTFGSFCRKDLWEEHKPFLVHFGTNNNPYCIEIQSLVNGKSFSSSHLFCLQIKNSAIGHIVYSTNRGLNHAADKKNSAGKINISDLRIRYIIHGDSSELRNTHNRNTLLTYYKDICFQFNYDFHKLTNFNPHIELSQTTDSVCFDLVIYNGNRKKTDLSSLAHAICQFSFHVFEKKALTVPVKNSIKSGFLITTMQKDNFQMYIKSSVKPNDWVLQLSSNEQKINGILLEEYAQNNEEYALQYDFITSTSAELPMDYSENPSDPINAIVNNINSITSLDFSKLQTICSTIFNIANEHNISVDIIKRVVLHLLTTIIKITSKNPLYENTINYEYTNIFVTLSHNTTIHDIENTILSTVEKLKREYTSLEESINKTLLTNSVIDVIKNEFSSPDLSLTYLATKLNKTESHISKTFHKQTGLTYIQYLTKVRMEHAIQLISDGETNYETISKKCGYEYLTSFLRTFKKHTGHTISQYKKHIVIVK